MVAPMDADSAACRDSNTRTAMYASVAVAVITVVAFGLALLAVPISGANCPGDCLGYPFLDSVDRYPRDYIWMFGDSAGDRLSAVHGVIAGRSPTEGCRAG